MILFERRPGCVRVGWPAFLGYARAGSIAVLNILGLQFVRVGACSAIILGS
jgi:hypothetical protein